MTSRYVMAQIHMPIEIKPDNTVVSLHEYADIHIQSVISDFDQLKRPSPNTSLIDQINAVFEKVKQEEDAEKEDAEVHLAQPAQLVVQREDIKPRARADHHNSSFKRKGPYTHRRTCKQRPPILTDMDVDSSQSLSAQAA
jgi:hypothetical protein